MKATLTYEGKTVEVEITEEEARIERMTPRESWDDMTDRVAIDRLMEMCRAITLTSQSWRSR